jgi:hypothetical protein
MKKCRICKGWGTITRRTPAGQIIKIACPACARAKLAALRGQPDKGAE